jgi:hypothetical protein
LSLDHFFPSSQGVIKQFFHGVEGNGLELSPERMQWGYDPARSISEKKLSYYSIQITPNKVKTDQLSVPSICVTLAR